MRAWVHSTQRKIEMKPSTEALVPIIETRSHAEGLPSNDPATPAIGKWYWVGVSRNSKGKKSKSKKIRGFTGRDDDAWLGCAVHIGSNYVKLEGPDGRSSRYSSRVHVAEFWDRCEYVPNPEEVIGKRVARHQGEVKRLMGEVNEITARLGVAPSPALSPFSASEAVSGSETHALALRNDAGRGDLDGYKKALVKAKTKELPALFEEIREHNDMLAVWLSAGVIPLKAQVDAMSPAIARIEDRIFSVELYAGLVEEVTLIHDGDPAPLGEKIHLYLGQENYWLLALRAAWNALKSGASPVTSPRPQGEAAPT
jgi:hypothetical protein